MTAVSYRGYTVYIGIDMRKPAETRSVLCTQHAVRSRTKPWGLARLRGRPCRGTLYARIL